MMEIHLGDTELQKNILKFGYGINYKYGGTLSNSFDRFYVVTKFELPKVQDLQFTTIPYDKGCVKVKDVMVQDVKYGWYMILHQFLDNSDSPSIVEQ